MAAAMTLNRTSGLAAPAEISSAMGAAARTVDDEHLPKVVKRVVYYGSESSCQVNQSISIYILISPNSLNPPS